MHKRLQTISSSSLNSFVQRVLARGLNYGRTFSGTMVCGPCFCSQWSYSWQAHASAAITKLHLRHGMDHLCRETQSTVAGPLQALYTPCNYDPFS